jgi:hypothetical protein
MSRSRLIAASALVLFALAVVACGIPSDDEPRAISSDALPSSLSESPEGTSTTVSNDSTLLETIYLVGASPTPDTATERLEPFTVELPLPADPDDRARALVERLIDTEQADITTPGVRNTIPSDTRVLGTSLSSDGVLRLDLSGNLAEIESNLQRLAIAQLIFTATGVNEVRSVVLSIDGQPAAVPAEAGAVPAGEPVTRENYPTFLQQIAAAQTEPGEG